MAFDSAVARRRQLQRKIITPTQSRFEESKFIAACRLLAQYGLKECPSAISVESEEFPAEADLDR